MKERRKYDIEKKDEEEAKEKSQEKRIKNDEGTEDG